VLAANRDELSKPEHEREPEPEPGQSHFSCSRSRCLTPSWWEVVGLPPARATL